MSFPTNSTQVVSSTANSEILGRIHSGDVRALKSTDGMFGLVKKVDLGNARFLQLGGFSSSCNVYVGKLCLAERRGLSEPSPPTTAPASAHAVRSAVLAPQPARAPPSGTTPHDVLGFLFERPLSTVPSSSPTPAVAPPAAASYPYDAETQLEPHPAGQPVPGQEDKDSPPSSPDFRRKRRS